MDARLLHTRSSYLGQCPDCIFHHRTTAQGLLQDVLEQQPSDPMSYFCTKIEEIREEMKESQVRRDHMLIFVYITIDLLLLLLL